MSTAPLRAAVIGAGHIAKQHLGAIAAAPGVDAVGVCDLSPIMAESTADRFGIAGWFTDFREMLDQQRPDVIHITTPPGSHFSIARECLLRDCHLLVEKPMTLEYEQFVELKALAAERNRWLLEDHNYQFNNGVQEMLTLATTGALGEVRHVDVQVCLDLFAPGSRFADQDLPHPALREPAGVVTDFLTHLCYLAYVFVGEHHGSQAFFNRLLPQSDSPITEFQALVNAERGTARLGLSATTQPDSFLLSVQGTQMSVTTNLFEVGTVCTKVMGGPQPLIPIRNSLRRGRREHVNAARSLWRKLSGGPGPYEGLWSLVAQMYANLQNGGPPPVPMAQVDAVNCLVHVIQAEVSTPCAC